jgi:Protein of unknown function (DUF2550)
VTEVLALVAGWVLLVVLAIAVIVAVGLASRRILLGRSGGTVECGLRVSRARAWRLGLAAYQPEALHWFSAFGLRLRPNEVFDRRSLVVLDRRRADSAEAVTIGAGTVIIECRVGQGSDGGAAGPGGPPRIVELAMSEAALTGFLAWLESAAPGHLSGLS